MRPSPRASGMTLVLVTAALLFKGAFRSVKAKPSAAEDTRVRPRLAA